MHLFSPSFTPFYNEIIFLVLFHLSKYILKFSTICKRKQTEKHLKYCRSRDEIRDRTIF